VGWVLSSALGAKKLRTCGETQFPKSMR